MAQVMIRDQIKRLVDLQTIDVEIYNFKKDLKEKPLVIASFQEKFENSKAGLKKQEEKLKLLQLDRKSKELDLQVKEGEISKANSSLSALKTNKEYQAKMNEIEHLKADKSIVEEKILMLFDEGDTINAQIDQEKKIVAEEEKKYLSEKKLLEDEMAGIQQKVTTLDAKRLQITPDVNPSLLLKYERILENKGGIALVPIRKHSCGGCYMNLPEQVINEIKMHDKLVMCEMCARILYLEDDL